MRWLALLLLFGSAQADWGWRDTTLEGASEVLIVLDWGTTRDIAWKMHHVLYPRSGLERPEYCGHEINPVLGRKPDMRTVDLYFGSWVLMHPVLSALLPEGRFRALWQAGTIGLEGYMVRRNVQFGLTVRF
jgi:hypothetical protein